MCTQLYILSHFCGGEGGKGRGASNQWLASGCQTPTGRPWHKAFIITINQTSKILGGLVDGNPGQDRTSSPSSAPSWRRPLSTLAGSTWPSVRNLALAIPYDISRGHGPEARSLVGPYHKTYRPWSVFFIASQSGTPYRQKSDHGDGYDVSDSSSFDIVPLYRRAGRSSHMTPYILQIRVGASLELVEEPSKRPVGSPDGSAAAAGRWDRPHGSACRRSRLERGGWRCAGQRPSR